MYTADRGHSSVYDNNPPIPTVNNSRYRRLIRSRKINCAPSRRPVVILHWVSRGFPTKSKSYTYILYFRPLFFFFFLCVFICLYWFSIYYIVLFLFVRVCVKLLLVVEIVQRPVREIQFQNLLNWNTTGNTTQNIQVQSLYNHNNWHLQCSK